MMASGLDEVVARYRWYHTLDLGQGVVTPGMFDHRPVVDRYLLPERLTGLRCLDVGTMDGFWAFEMERRGADEILAVDLDDPDALDWPESLRRLTVKTLDETKGERFEIAREALGSRVQRHIRSVYELDTDLGLFDLVFCGDLLVHLKDPITAVERIRRVCQGRAIICTPISRSGWFDRRPVAELDGIAEFQWWLFSQSALERLVRAAGFAQVESARPFDLPATSGGKWRGRRGVVMGHV